ncbi:diphthamide biosynthesis enzyme Dph2 [Candidatus Pacearchaeota archaeon]|nr:diphthamide biosynthesis enzyme Dph2 [Candidatus Pacearchaeota archaeon]
MTLNFELPKLVRELKKRKPKKVLVQLPEGIKQNAAEISGAIEKLGIKVIFSGETAWGGCALALQEAEALKVDLIVHFGHAEFIKTKFPVLYIEVRDELDLKPILEKSLKKIEKFKTLGLSYSIQHRHDVEMIKEFYEKRGKKIILSKKIGFAAYEGHVIGCEYRGLKAIEKDVDAFLIIGNQFHSMGAALAVEKPVVLVDVYNDDVKSMDGLREKILKQRAISIQKLKDAKDVGIIIEIKPGQKFGEPKYLVEKLKEKGKNAIVITMNELTPEKIMNFYHIDAFIELACPRVAVDDFAKYSKPILTFKEALVALGIKSWEEFLEKGIV